MHPSSSRIDRRSLLALAAAAALPAALPGAVASAAVEPPRHRPFNPADPSSLLAGYRKVLFSSNEELVFWWMKGTKYGMVDNVTQPFYNMEVVSIMRCHSDAADRFTVGTLEMSYYTDLASGALLDRWQNPYTSEWLDMKYVPVGPTKLTYTPSGPQMPMELPGVKIASTHAMGPVTVVGNDAWLRNDSNAVVTRTDGPGKPFLVHDWAIYHAQLTDIENEALASAPATVSFTDLTSWPRSMKMGDRAGTRMSRTVGRKVGSLAALPPSLVAILERQQPQVLRDPAAALDKPANQFDR